MGLDTAGRILLIIGLSMTLLGGVLLLISRFPPFANLENMPGSIHIEGQGYTCFIPLLSMCLLSVILTLVLNVIARLANR